MENRPDYYSIKMLSNSSLKLFGDYSPRKALHLMNNGLKETDALIMGRLIHHQTLEPDTFFDFYEYLPDGFNLRTKENKAFYQDIIDSGKTPVKPDMRKLADAITNRIFESKNAKNLLSGIAEKEYFGEIDGIKIKSKVDLVNPDRGYILDLKTTLNAEPEAFIKEMENRYYLQQAWLYRELANQNGENIKKFFFLNVEKVEPFSMSIVEVSKLQFEIGKEQFYHNLALYKYALENPDKDFDSLPEGTKTFIYDTPEWMVRKYDLEGE